MKVHNRSPTEKALHKNEQCRHTFEITHKRCAPCSGYDTNWRFPACVGDGIWSRYSSVGV